MRYWDALAVVPLLVAEQWTMRCRELFREDPYLLVWWGTEVECASAIGRRERDGIFDADTARRAIDRLAALGRQWDEVHPVSAVRERARRLLRVHPLRAVDSLQLGAALVAAGGHPASLAFVCLDERLAEAAAREGLSVVTA